MTQRQNFGARLALLAGLSVTILTACGTTPTVVNPSCDAFERITWAWSGDDQHLIENRPDRLSEAQAEASDTPETINQIRRHNAAYAATCGSQ
jgi:hypothetical protein